MDIGRIRPWEDHMYRGRLERDIAQWVHKGLLSEAIGQSLLNEVDSRESSFGPGKVLMVLAALLVSAAILMLVASNWEAIPRVFRLSGIVAILWLFYGAGAWFLERGARTLGTALLIVGTLSFGGAISLVGQMYHLSGDAEQAMLIWFTGAVVAALLFRSAAVTVVAGFLSWVVFGVAMEGGLHVLSTNLVWLAPVMAGIVIFLVYINDAPRARHTAYLLILALIVALYFEENDLRVALAMVAAGAAGYGFAAVPLSPLKPIADRAGAAPAFYTFLLGGLGLGLVHLENNMELWGQVMLSAFTMAYSIAGAVMSGRNNGAVRYLGYGIFAAECLYVASETFGSIIGTSGFFLASGVFVALIAWIVVRLERRLMARPVADTRKEA
jgi:uncharacterized membrane protein